jgi:osmotically-inducible protein OsmY
MKPMLQKTLSVLALSGAAVCLNACVPLPLLLGGGAFTGGVMVATDRRTSGTLLEDNSIDLKSSSRISENLGERVHVNVTSYNRQVLLTGEVPSEQDKQLVEKVVANVENVRVVFNELAVLGNSTLTQRSSDALVTSRVKGGLVDAKDLSASAFKITTERGTVYLLGRVTKREANRATEIARGADGAQRIVTYWEYISEDELTRMLPAAPPDTKTPANSKPATGSY